MRRGDEDVRLALDPRAVPRRVHALEVGERVLGGAHLRRGEAALAQRARLVVERLELGGDELRRLDDGVGDLGLDVHVRLNVSNDDSNAGSDYPWGPTRWSDSDVQEPVSSGEYEGYIGPWYASVIAIQITSFVSLVMLSLLAGYIPRWRRDVESIPFDPMWSALVAWSPCLMFATGRGYDEAILALILGISVFWLFFVGGNMPEAAARRSLDLFVDQVASHFPGSLTP